MATLATGRLPRPRAFGERFLTRVGGKLMATCEELGDFVLLAARAAKVAVTRPFPFSIAVEQFMQLIVRSAPLLLLAAGSVGAVMALQFGLGMSRFGGKLYVPTVVAVSIVRALGPVFTCLLLAGRVGAGIAAEIGGMTVGQQVDALRTLGADPIEKLVVPRLAVLIIGTPLLTLLADCMGILGGLAAGVGNLGISSSLYIQKSIAAVKLDDVVVGTGKTVIYGFFIGLIACHLGLKKIEGTKGIGVAATRAVVAASIFVMFADLVITKLSWILRW
jgi:phospholipid/cholesterol/gamma-HCH transport system permease protein